jgi:TonB family protein
MLGHLLHIAVALFAFALGFLFAAPHKYLAYALPLALLVFVLAKAAPTLGADLGSLCVVAASLLFLSAGIYATFTTFDIFYWGSCGVEFSGERDTSAATSYSYSPPVDSEETGGKTFAGITAYNCGNDGARGDIATHNSIWAGVINKKAVRKPAPVYSSYAKSERSSGAVAVAVLVNESGTVTQAQALSGHTLLRQPAMEAACRARFSPIITSGSPLRVSGILTYDFDF